MAFRIFSVEKRCSDLVKKVALWCLSCFKPSTKHDPSEDRFEAETNIVTEISLIEDVIKCQRRSEDDQLNWAIQESFKPQESKRTSENDQQIACALQYEETEFDNSVVDEEDEQLSRIVEEDLKEKGEKYQNEDDQKVALMFQESLYMAEPPPRPEKNKSISIKAPLDEDEQRVILESFKGKGQIKQSKDETDLNVNPPHGKCDGCNSTVEYGRYVYVLGAYWHPECFCCLHCRKPIAIDEFYSKGRFHRSCYKEHRHPNCYVCEKKISATAEGLKYNEHSFWKEKYCPCHEVDQTPKCCCCERLEPCGMKYVLLADNRWLCVQCMECAVMDTYEVQPLHFEIREFFDGLNMKIEKEFPLFLVEKEAINKAEKEEKIEDNQHGVVTRSICLSEARNVHSCIKRPKMGPNMQMTEMVTETQKVVGDCEVTAILILYGLPRMLTGYILAHEMMHAWLRLNGYRNLKLELEEGLCQVLGHMWLDSQRYSTTAASASSSSSCAPAANASKKGAHSDYEKKLVEFCKHQIETDDSPVYGLGFRRVNQMVTNSSLQETLKQIHRWASNTKPDSDR